MKPAAAIAIILLTLTLALPAAAAGSSYQISAYPDDATWFSGSFAYDDQLVLNDVSTIATRFIVGVPFGAVISSVQLELVASSNVSSCSTTMALENNLNALNFESGPALNMRQMFSPVAITIPVATADEMVQLDANIATDLTLLVGQSGYIPDQSSIVITVGPCNDSGEGEFYSYDLSPANAPRLLVSYTMPTHIYMITLPSGALGIVEMRASFGELAVIIAAAALALLTLWAQLRQAAWLISKRSGK